MANKVDSDSDTALVFAENVKTAAGFYFNLALNCQMCVSL